MNLLGQGQTSIILRDIKLEPNIKIGTNTTREFITPVIVTPNESFYKYSATEDLTGIKNNRNAL